MYPGAEIFVAGRGGGPTTEGREGFGGARLRVSSRREARRAAEGKAGVRQLKVRWSGYHPSWEKCRLPGDGEAGGAASTWEPASGLAKTDAYKAWEEQQ